MITKEENDRLTRVGPGTPGGELLRRYWYPVAAIDDLDATPTRFVRVLGEDLVLFKDKSGNVGLIQDHCVHRGASLVYGRVEERGISCAYHGWLYDTQGNCLETPAEPSGSMFHLTVKMRAYPVESYAGLYWAYLGPSPAPILPRYDMLEHSRIVHIQEFPCYDANWVQLVENTLDGAHIYVLHQDTMKRTKPVDNTTRGLLDELKEFSYWEIPFGIMRHQELVDGYVEDDPMVFPNTLRRMNQLVIAVPIDDTHTAKWDIFVADEERGAGLEDGEVEAGVIEHYVLPHEDAILPPDAAHVYPRHRMDRLRLQDFMAVETQGPITPRESWRLAGSDRGIALFWEMLAREADKVQEGGDPIGVIRDPAQAVHDTNFDAARDLSGRATWPDGLLVYPRREPAAAR
jgi:5,5'-dehydrodivanillate O-demethylase oxygenase subunit